VFHDGAAVDFDAIHVAGDLGVERDGEEREELPREIDGAGDRAGDDGD
jgi:hypothetical protein